jgi:soluble lytic murein transglycosylase
LSVACLAGLSLSFPQPAPAAPAAGLSDLRSGAAALDADRASEALAALQRSASQEGPLRDLAWLLLGRAALAAGEPERALAAAALAPDAVPASVRRADADWLGAEALTALGRHEDAAAAWARFAVRHPGGPRATRARVREAEALEAAGRPAEASRAWRRLALQSPAAAPADALDRARRLAASAGVAFPPPGGGELTKRADRLAKANLHARAVAAYQEAEAVLAGRAGTDIAMMRRADSLYRLRRNDECREVCRELVKRFPSSDYKTAALHRRVRVAWRQDRGEELLAGTAAARDSTKHRGSSWRDDLLHVRAGYFMEKKRWDDAVIAFERVLSEHPESKLADDSRWKAAWCRLNQGRAAEAAERFETLATVGKEDELVRGASYWAGVVRGRLGEKESSQAWLEKTYRRWPFRYHGVQARELLSGYLTAAEAAVLDAEIERSGSVFEHPGPHQSDDPRFHRYELLRDAGLHGFALPELESLRREVKDSDSLVFELARARSRSGTAAAGYSLLAKRFWKQLQRPSRSSSPEFWEVAYPRPFGAELDRLCRERGLDVSLAAGLVRSESWWNPTVRSTADARGLMQLVPGTGLRMARAEGLSDFDPAQLFQPELNLRLGTRYLAALVGQFGGDRAAAAASYNAGEDKVAAWWAAFDAENVEFGPERVARIPYKETRRYVRKVLEAAAWYRWLAAGTPGTGGSGHPGR